MVISEGYSSSMRLTISRGDQCIRSLEVTYRQRRCSPVSLRLPCLRNLARSYARLLAEKARYPVMLLFLAISREMVPVVRPRLHAIAERCCPCARPRLISSRSADDIRRYCICCAIRIYCTHIRCVRCLTPSTLKRREIHI